MWYLKRCFPTIHAHHSESQRKQKEKNKRIDAHRNQKARIFYERRFNILRFKSSNGVNPRNQEHSCHRAAPDNQPMPPTMKSWLIQQFVVEQTHKHGYQDHDKSNGHIHMIIQIARSGGCESAAEFKQFTEKRFHTSKD